MFVEHSPTLLDAETRKAIRANSSTVNSNSKRVAELEKRMETLISISEALWEIVRSKHGLEAQLLEAKIDEIEARRLAKEQIKVECSSCHLPVHQHKERCIYCGTPLARLIE